MVSGPGKIQVEGRNLRVAIVGWDGSGWALDTDGYLTIRRLEAFCDLVEDETHADIVHSIWPENMASRWDVMKKTAMVPLVLTFSNDPFRQTETPAMLSLMDRAAALVGQSSQAVRQLGELGYENVYFVPYAAEPDLFFPLENNSAELNAFRGKLNIPGDAYVVGNFFRDSLGDDRSRPKQQKGADLFLAMLRKAQKEIGNRSLVVLLAGPRRHWLRAGLAESRIPYRFYGKAIEGEDFPQNILPKETMNALYQLCDLQVIPSRWEGGPRGLMESLHAGTPIISTRVGMAEDILPRDLLFDSATEGADLIIDDVGSGRVKKRYAESLARLNQLVDHSSTTLALRAVYENIVHNLTKNPARVAREGRVPLYPSPGGTGLVTGARRIMRAVGRRLSSLIESPASRPSVNLWNTFMPPPYGGANQFFLALEKGLQVRGVEVRRNDWRRPSDAHIFNGIWFDHQKFAEVRTAFPKSIFLHRIDGPISRYRETDPSENDDIVFSLNEKMDFTIYQSLYSLNGCRELGYNPVRPSLIRNAVDAAIFHPNGRLPFAQNSKIKLLSMSWSSNIKKGRDSFIWLDKNLDFDKVDYTFVGQIDATLENTRVLPAAPSEEVAAHMREADIFIFCSQLESASNVVTEAMACGLPIIYLDSGGTWEIVDKGGIGYKNHDEIPELIDRMAADYECYQQSIYTPTIDDVAQAYLKVIEAGQGRN